MKVARTREIVCNLRSNLVASAAYAHVADMLCAAMHSVGNLANIFHKICNIFKDILVKNCVYKKLEYHRACVQSENIESPKHSSMKYIKLHS